MTTTISFPTTVQFGSGASNQVGPSLANAGFSRPLVVTDQGIAALDIFPQLLDSLLAAGLSPATFTNVFGNPMVSHVEDAAEVFQSHDGDCVVGVGGGAALDVAKAVLVSVTNPGHLFEYEDIEGAKPIEGPLPYFVAIPTTAGTGSEVGRSAVISDDETHIKKIIFAPELLASEVFADPDLTVGLPPHLTAATGMDALTHNIEAYLAKDWHPMCDGIALEGVRLCSNFLERATNDGSDIEARTAMLMASMMGAVAFQKGLGVVHSCAHALGTVAGVHHGLANAVMLDHAVAFNAEVSAERFSILGQVVGVDPSPVAFLGWIKDLKTRLEIPTGLSGIEVDPGSAERLVEIAVDDICHLNNPRVVTGPDFSAIFEAAFSA